MGSVYHRKGLSFYIVEHDKIWALEYHTYCFCGKQSVVFFIGLKIYLDFFIKNEPLRINFKLFANIDDLADFIKTFLCFIYFERV